MHRDVKPANLFWNRAAQTMRLGDLGIATYVRPSVPELSQRSMGEIPVLTQSLWLPW